MKNLKNLKLVAIITLVIGLFSCKNIDEDINGGIQKAISVEKHPEWKAFFDSLNVVGTVVISEVGANKQWIYNEKRANIGFLPASTYKIMNSMIGLETGVIALTDTIRWDGRDVWNDNWKKNHVLKTAFEVSCVPCYQQLARRVGVDSMKKYVEENNYGIMDIRDTTLDIFWLRGESVITPMEQVAFLTNLVNEELSFSKKTMNAVKEMMINEQTSEYILRGKTGWAQYDNTNMGWFVGYLTKDEKDYVFVSNMERRRDVSSDGFAEARKKVVKQALEALGILSSKKYTVNG